jgi:hypothetical protein
MIALAEPKWPFFFNPAIGMASRGSLQLAKTSSNAIAAANLAFGNHSEQERDSVEWGMLFM